MTSEIIPSEPEKQKITTDHHGGSSDTVYALGVIGAWVYYFKRAATFREGVQGFLKGIVWPAILVYELLVFLNEK